jgi:hypothetical protein
MDQDTLWTDGDDQDLDTHLTARVEAGHITQREASYRASRR